MDDEKRLRKRVVFSSFLFLAAVIGLAWLLRYSHPNFVVAIFIVGWFVFLGYMLKLRSLGRKKRSRE